MARLSFNKASLHKESHRLKLYQQYLPSLDLKRQQLLAERTKVIAQLKEIEERIHSCRKTVSETLPMLANQNFYLENLVKVKRVDVAEENIVGIRVPVLAQVEIETMTYSTYAKPHWVDSIVIHLKTMLELKLMLQVHQKRVEILEKAVKKVTQKVNLFDKVLIPKALHNIRKIRIYLSDAERAGVVRAKITKQNRMAKGI